MTVLVRRRRRTSLTAVARDATLGLRAMRPNEYTQRPTLMLSRRGGFSVVLIIAEQIENCRAIERWKAGLAGALELWNELSTRTCSTVRCHRFVTNGCSS